MPAHGAEKSVGAPRATVTPHVTPTLQRECATCEADERDVLQRKETNGQAPPTSEVDSRIDSLRGGGEPLSENARAFFEPRFNYDFGGVRIHTDQRATATARALNARAFTTGHDIAFGAGEYRPEVSDGQKLLAHELAHVIQQGGSSPSLQFARLTDEEKEENLKSVKYSRNARLEKAFDNDPTLKKGETSDAVKLVQEGLVADGFEMPISTKPTGEMDSVFGDETFRTVQKFQRKHNLSDDGIVGRETLRKLDEQAQSIVLVPGCPTDANAFEVTNERVFTNPKFDFDFTDGERPTLSTRAPSAPFRWNASVKTRGQVQGCFEIGFLQTLRSSFQAAVYGSPNGQEKTCLVMLPTPIRDAKTDARQPWFMDPMRLGTNCFTGLVLPPGISPNIDQQTALMDDNPFLQWCVFLDSGTTNPASDCGLSNAAFRLNTIAETLAFDAWLVVRQLGSTDNSCFTFLRHATWVKSVEIIASTTGTLGFLRRNLGVTLVDLGDGVGPTKPEFGSDTPNEIAERVCL